RIRGHEIVSRGKSAEMQSARKIRQDSRDFSPACRLLIPPPKGEVYMKTGRSLGRAGGALLALSVLFGITLFSGVTAQAQNPNWGDGQYRRDRDQDNDRDRDRDRDRNRDRRRERDERWRRDRRYDPNNGGGYGRNDGYGRNGGYGGYGRNGGYGNGGFGN